MKCQVVKEFRDLDGAVRIIGETIDVDADRAALLRRHGLVGRFAPGMTQGAEKTTTRTAEKAVQAAYETAVDSSVEIAGEGDRRRPGRPRKQG